MRLLALLLTCACLAVAGWFGYDLWQRLQTPPPAVPTLAAALPDETGAQPDRAGQTRAWPSLFGTRDVPEPQPPQPPAPPAPPMPPIDSLGYRLKGVVSAEGGNWAIVTHPTGDVILKPGDDLTEGIQVDEIDDQGLWLTRGGDRVLLGFDAPAGQ
ncbi:hypothetical protein K3727_21420 (plasmid) [Rhodobacteraceae bacterium M382]|nr:hypothetical protein K3727_21420 [Rhodobacteraceae bacterium M382]